MVGVSVIFFIRSFIWGNGGRGEGPKSTLYLKLFSNDKIFWVGRCQIFIDAISPRWEDIGELPPKELFSELMRSLTVEEETML